MMRWYCDNCGGPSADNPAEPPVGMREAFEKFMRTPAPDGWTPPPYADRVAAMSNYWIVWQAALASRPTGGPEAAETVK